MFNRRPVTTPSLYFFKSWDLALSCDGEFFTSLTTPTVPSIIPILVSRLCEPSYFPAKSHQLTLLPSFCHCLMVSHGLLGGHKMSGNHESEIKRNDWHGKSWLMSRGRKWVGGSGYMCPEREPSGGTECVLRGQTARVWVPVLSHAGQQIKPVASLLSPIKERH